MRLNMGCGANKLPGYVNVDKFEACAPDRVVDLEVFPWPFDDSVAEEVVFRHVLEHVGRDTQIYLDVIRELYRICRPGAVIQIMVPHPRHDSFLNDPTHVRPITPQGLELFSKARNREWANKGMANSPLGLYLDVDFEIVSVNMILDEPWLGRFNRKQISRDELTQAMRMHNNVVREIDIRLRVVK